MRPSPPVTSRHSRTMTAAAFKAQCLSLMDLVATEGSEIIVTKRGTPVAKLVPVAPSAASAWGWMRDTATASGDLIAPEPVWDMGDDPLDAVPRP